MAAKTQSKAAAKAKQLKDRQALFVEAYVECLNAAEAARRAGYSAKTARSIGWENLTKPDIREEIDRRLAARQMSKDEVLTRLTDQAGSSMADFLKLVKSDNGKSTVAVFDFAKAQRLGKLHLIKEFKIGIEGVSVKLYDSQAALVHLGRYHKAFVDKVEHSGEIVSLTPAEMEAKRNKRWAETQAALALAQGGGPAAEPANA